jgi:hypothetical protein
MQLPFMSSQEVFSGSTSKRQFRPRALEIGTLRSNEIHFLPMPAVCCTTAFLPLKQRAPPSPPHRKSSFHLVSK